MIDIRLNKDLFARVKAVYDNRESLNLNKEQKKLLEETIRVLSAAVRTWMQSNKPVYVN